MKKVLMALSMALALASCSKEDPVEKEQMLPAGTRLTLDISGETTPEQFKGLTYKLEGNKLKAKLTPGQRVPVYTCIYNSSNQIVYYSQTPLEWEVLHDGKTLAYRGAPIELTGTLGSSATLRAVIAHGGLKDGTSLPRLEILNTSSLKVVADNDEFAFNLPYVLESRLRVQGGKIYNFDLPASARKFKPKGYLFKVKLRNKTTQTITVNKISEAGLIPTDGSILEMFRLDNSTLRRELNLSESITLTPTQTSTKSILVWLPKLPTDANYTFKAEFNGSESKAFFTSKLLSKASSGYTEGKMYHRTLNITPMRNPLEYLHGVYRGVGRDRKELDAMGFVDPGYSVPLTANYQRTDDGGLFHFWASPTEQQEGVYSSTYPPGVTINAGGIPTHVPTKTEWQSILINLPDNGPYTPISQYTAKFGKREFNFVADQISTNLEGNATDGYEIYAIRFNLPYGDKSMRHAFRYQALPRGFKITAVYIGSDSRYETVQDIKNNLDWSQGVTRIMTYSGSRTRLSDQDPKDWTPPEPWRPVYIYAGRNQIGAYLYYPTGRTGARNYDASAGVVTVSYLKNDGRTTGFQMKIGYTSWTEQMRNFPDITMNPHISRTPVAAFREFNDED